MTDFIADIVSESVDEAVRRLVNVEHFRAGSLVSMPVSYPSGATVVVEITAQKDRCFVSDRGGGHQEAEFFGASRYFATEARRLADLAGIRFDGRDMFVAEVPRERLRGAMVTVANCSAAATNAAALRLSERADRDARDDLYVRLSSLYKTRDVQKDPQFRGATTKWRVSVAVLGGHHRPAFFEPVSGVYISAVGTAAKFNDFAATESPPDRFSVMKSRNDLGDFYGLVARASTKLLPMTSPDQTFVELLEAA
jgi:hypothetical protein